LTRVEIPEAAFGGDEAFHTVIAEVMGFPEFYGNNWSAFVDCMSYIDDPDGGMSKVTVEAGDLLEILILVEHDNDYFNNETWAGFTSAVAAVNGRFFAENSKTRIVITETTGS
jgi:hypothetical protein